MFTKSYQLECDSCGRCEHFHADSKSQAKEQAMEMGHILKLTQLKQGDSCRHKFRHCNVKLL
ncbi:MAG: hypothetical protein HAW67_01390 [Endozoicomonadaceae bacterium]|nr:hypothetical protein [Endozoicomonadaceae bacterium]